MPLAVEACGWQGQWRQLVRALVRIHTPRGEQQLLATLTQPAHPTVVAFVNAHAMNSAAVSRDFFEAVRAADVILRDGIGMAILLKLLDCEPGLNLNGTDLIPKILRQYAGQPIALFGTEEPYLGRAKDVIVSSIATGSACTTAHGFHDTETYVNLANEQRPALIVLGMGMPRQEMVARELRARLDAPCLIVCGGAIIDFLGGKTSRAPRWMRGVGLEWLFRLVLEPKRLFRRYVIGNPVFLARALAVAAATPRPRRGAPT